MNKTPVKKTFYQEMGYPENHGKVWTIEDMFKLCELYLQEEPILTWRSIAEEMKRTVNAVYHRIFIIKLAFTLTKEKDVMKIMGKLVNKDKKVKFIRHQKYSR